MQYLLFLIGEGCDFVNWFYYCDFIEILGGLKILKDINFILFFMKLVDNFEVQYFYVVNDGLIFIFFMNKNVFKYKVMRVSINDLEVWWNVIFEFEIDVFSFVRCVNEKNLLVCYIYDVKYVF